MYGIDAIVGLQTGKSNFKLQGFTATLYTTVPSIWKRTIITEGTGFFNNKLHIHNKFTRTKTRSL